MLSSALLGASLGFLGRALAPSDRLALAAVAGVGAAAVARELRLLRLPLPQLKRQTSGAWSKSLGQPLASFLWGLDIGFVFTTWLTFSGAWLVATLALVTHDPAFGAVALLAYWIGRALTVWIAPFWISHPGKAMELMVEIGRERQLFRRLHALALGVITVVFVAAQSSLFTQ